jgi:hypothetical protein
MDVKAFVTEHTAVIGELCDVMVSRRMSSEDGEKILAWMLGISMGTRQVSLKSDDMLEMLAAGWVVGAEYGDS